MIPISMLVLGYALNCRENLTFQTLGFGILVFGNNGAQCACKDNFQNEVVGCFFQEMVKKTMAFLIKYRQLCSCFPQMSLSTSFSPFQHVPQKQFRTSHGQTAWHSKKHSRTQAPCPDCRPAAKNFKNLMLPGVDGFLDQFDSKI